MDYNTLLSFLKILKKEDKVWLIWKWIGLGLMIIVYFLLVYWQRRHWRSPSAELGIVTITMMLFDWLMTWLGQPFLYWQRIGWVNVGIVKINLPSAYIVNEVINEVNPFGWFLLGWHPMAFVAAFIFYMIIVIALIRIFCQWSSFLMIALSTAVALAHGYCALQWLFDSKYPLISKWIGWWINDVPFLYLPFIIIGLLIGILLIRKKRNRS